MNKQAIINEKIQSIQTEAIPLRTVMKKTLMYLYSKGVIPKPITQNIYDILRLKDS